MPVFEYTGDDTRTYPYATPAFTAEPGMDPFESATNPDELRFVEQSTKPTTRSKPGAAE